ncbi:MAG: peptide deformylase [Gaiella sp.]
MSEHDHDHEHDEEHDLPEEALSPEEEAAALEHEARRRVALAQVRQYGDPVLRMRAGEVTEVDDEVRSVAERMLAIMHDADGIGLAATQVGILRRMFVCMLDDEDVVVVNPVLVAAGAETETGEEGCLSLGSVRVPVERPLQVTLEGLDREGAALRLELNGLQARVVQHELDHLDGTLIVDRTDSDSRREALRKLRPRLALR